MRPGANREHEPHVIYEATNPEGVLLYIGVCRHDRVKQRWRQHQLGSLKWCRHGTEFRIIGHAANRKEAVDRETALIQERNPQANVVRNLYW